MLLEPQVLRTGARARNRIWLAPMTNGQSHLDGTLADAEYHWLERRARGGFGVIETCAAHVALDGQGWAGELGVYDDRMVPGLTRLATMIREAGALGIVQIFHGGVRAPASLIGQQPWSASNVMVKGAPDEPRPGTREDLERVIEQFRAAAVRCHTAGFDGIEIHGAHGYLLTQFLSSITNQRTDDWGGSFANRSRLLREVTRAVRRAVPASFAVGVRLSPEDFGATTGLDLDESLELAKLLCDDGVDFLHVSLWDSHQNTRKRPSEHPIPLFRAAVPHDVALVVAGSIWTPAEAESLLAKGASAVALGRSAIANPDWAARAGDPAWEPRRPPLTPAELVDRGLSPTFVDYMRRWKGFVADA